MTPKTLDFKCALITGGGGGLGKAMAEHLIKLKKKVIIVGRTESNLKSAAEELGNGTRYYVLDTGKISDIRPFVKKLLEEHPELDCLINNAGVQRQVDLHNTDLEVVNQEIAINIQGPIHLATYLIPHLKAQPGGGVIMNVTSVLGIIPFSIINPTYNASKAYMRFYTMNLRDQLRDTNLKIVEIVPPTVSTELHRDRSDPKDNTKEKNPSALSTEEFMEYVGKGWANDVDTIGAGSAVGLLDKWYETFGAQYEEAVKK